MHMVRMKCLVTMILLLAPIGQTNGETVVINEFLASNGSSGTESSGLVDEDGDSRPEQLLG